MMRRWLIWVVLICTLVACWWVEQAGESSNLISSQDKPRIQQKKTSAQVLPAVKEGIPVVILSPNPATEVNAPIVNLFDAMDIPGTETAEPEVAEPVNPYTFAGRLQEDGHWVVFLTDGQQQYVLHEGEQFAEGWRVAILDQQKVVLQHKTGRFEIKLDNGVVF